MNPIFSRTLKALCSVMAVALLSACGASTTVDPFNPTRVIGLGDAYNDMTSSSIYTVRGTGTVETVVGQVAALLGVSSANVTSYAASGSNISALTAQISSAKSAAGGAFTGKELIVITAGTADIKAAYGTADASAAAEAAAAALTLHIEQLVADGARHILVMQPLEFSLTPFAANSRGTYALNTSTSPTVKFINKVSLDLQTFVSQRGYSTNPIIFGGLGLSSTFNDYVSRGVVGVFANSTAPICSGGATDIDGCDGLTSDSNYLFADGVNLTPLGNRWVGGYMFNAMRQGWR